MTGSIYLCNHITVGQLGHPVSPDPLLRFGNENILENGRFDFTSRVGVFVVSPPSALDPHIHRVYPLALDNLLVVRTYLTQSLAVGNVVKLVIPEVERLHVVAQRAHLPATILVVITVAIDDDLFEFEVIDIFYIDPCDGHDDESTDRRQWCVL